MKMIAIKKYVVFLKKVAFWSIASDSSTYSNCPPTFSLKKSVPLAHGKKNCCSTIITSLHSASKNSLTPIAPCLCEGTPEGRRLNKNQKRTKNYINLKEKRVYICMYSCKKNWLIASIALYISTSKSFWESSLCRNKKIYVYV